MYVPKSRIKTGLYTQDGELVLAGTTIPYTGYYYELYNGQYYSGQTPDSENSVRLVKAPPSRLETSVEDIDKVFINTLTDNIDPNGLFVEQTSSDINSYLSLTQDPQNTKLIPAAITPTVSQDNYDNGQFIRYFAKKSNELRYLEISESTYTKLKNRSRDYLWEHYLVFSLPWMLTGKKETVGKVNRDITVLTEQRLKIKGLQQFLKYDYLKFYKES